MSGVKAIKVYVSANVEKIIRLNAKLNGRSISAECQYRILQSINNIENETEKEELVRELATLKQLMKTQKE